MPVLSRAQVAMYAQQAGFTGNALNIAVAIAEAESSFNTQAKLVNTGGSIDRGLWQINNFYHPEISDAQAYDPAGAARGAYAISNRGTNFTPWVTYTTGAYTKYMQAIAPGTTMPSSTLTPSLKWVNIPITHGYITTHLASDPDSPHYAVDIGMPFHTQIGAVVNGTVYQADYAVWAGQPGGGEVFIHNDTGGPDWYVYHLDQINVKVGQHVSVGTVVGLSGGQNSGGSHPVSPMWSTGPHLHTGWFTSYKTSAIGSRPYGPDFTPYLSQLKSGNIPPPNGVNTAGTDFTNSTGLTGTTTGAGSSFSGGTSLANLGGDLSSVVNSIATLFGLNPSTPAQQPEPFLDQLHQTLISHPGFYGIALSIDEAEKFPGYEDLATGPFDIVGIVRSMGASIADNSIPFLIRSGVASLGMLIIVLLVAKIAMGATEKLGPLLQLAAMAA